MGVLASVLSLAFWMRSNPKRRDARAGRPPAPVRRDSSQAQDRPEPLAPAEPAADATTAPGAGPRLSRATRASTLAVAGVVLAATATIAFGAAPGAGRDAERALALAVTTPAFGPDEESAPPASARTMLDSDRFSASETPTPSVTPAAPTAAARGGVTAASFGSGSSASAAAIKEWARQAGWPARTLDEVVAVAWCESTHRPDATNGVAYGLMQVVPLWFSYAGVPFSQWSDPVSNLRAAYAAYMYDLNRGYERWTQWQCKPWAVTAAPVEGGVVEALPTAEPSPTEAPTATPSPFASATPTRTAPPPETAQPTATPGTVAQPAPSTTPGTE